MKYRVRLNLAFDKEADAKALMDFAKTLTNKAETINEGKMEEELSYCDYHKCMHDEIPVKPCIPIERIEVRKISPIPIPK